jgi:hypothetical protein
MNNPIQKVAQESVTTNRMILEREILDMRTAGPITPLPRIIPVVAEVRIGVETAI